MNGFDGGMDEPFHLLYETVMDRWPNSKFVLTLDDPEHWFDSYVRFFEDTPGNFPFTRFLLGPGGEKYVESLGLEKNISVGVQCGGSRYWGCDFGVNANETKEQ